jgi:hypothetical protein
VLAQTSGMISSLPISPDLRTDQRTDSCEHSFQCKEMRMLCVCDPCQKVSVLNS